ncbi:hypothetical protein T4D_14392 [Trichinella pseudospiralis]|uniref:Uncharacterized protein n=1 Tax=Trichinella pseudospiralis TaxID=6337 RepID=A0A0V1FN76_TRIPS|nr:hypothetical protein T4D_14392 [Trichinella pseudospiralis]
MIKHRYGDRYLHNEALEIIFRRLELSQALLLIGHFIFDCRFVYYSLKNKPECSNIFAVHCWHQLTHNKGTNGKQLFIPLWYNLEYTIYVPGLHGCQQSDVGIHSKY